jgi:hypothetical protein
MLSNKVSVFYKSSFHIFLLQAHTGTGTATGTFCDSILNSYGTGNGITPNSLLVKRKN